MARNERNLNVIVHSKKKVGREQERGEMKNRNKNSLAWRGSWMLIAVS